MVSYTLPGIDDLDDSSATTTTEQQGSSSNGGRIVIDYTLVNALTYSPLQIATLSLIKHVPLLDTSYALSDQLHFLNLFGPASSSSALTESSTASAAGTLGEPSTSNTDSIASSSVYEGLHRLVHWGVAPAFEAFVESKKGRKDDAARKRVGGDDTKDADGKMGIPMTKKKFAELELSLLHRAFPSLSHT